MSWPAERIKKMLHELTEYSCKIDTVECDAVLSMMKLRVMRPNYGVIIDLSFYDIDGVVEYLDDIFRYRQAMGLAHTVTSPLKLDQATSALALTRKDDCVLISQSQVMSGAEGHPLYSVVLDGVDLLVLKGKKENDWIVHSVDVSQRPLYTPHSLSGPEFLNLHDPMRWRLYIADQPVLQWSCPYNDDDWQFLSGLKSGGSTRVSAVFNMHGWVDVTIGMSTRRFPATAWLQSADGCYVGDYSPSVISDPNI